MLQLTNNSAGIMNRGEWERDAGRMAYKENVKLTMNYSYSAKYTVQPIWHYKTV